MVIIYSRSRLPGAVIVTLGGVLLVFTIYFFIENANKLWIDKGLFTTFFVLPICIIAFFLLSFGLLLLFKSLANIGHE